MGGWTFAIDRGGTFTDVVARHSDGRQRIAKLLSADPARYADSALEGIRRILEEEGGEVESVRMGTTVATNALLERKGERCALAITRGFADALRIGTQARPEIFARRIVLPSMLYDEVIEIEERIGADGAIVRPLDVETARQAIGRLRQSGFDSIAIVLVHGWAFPEHEEKVAQIARSLGFSQVSVSSEVAPLIKLVPRGDTTVVDSYLSPILGRYVRQVAAGLEPSVDLHFMQSNGGLAEANAFRGKDAILSGPAGGVVGMAATGAALGEDLLIGFDMGGTSTDVSHFAGRFELAEESVVAGVRVRAPMMQVHTVAAGGGSICSFDGMRFRVGPDSAGADPGPACYRKGGPLTVTDCNLALGRIDPEHFPHVFGPCGDEPLDRLASLERLEEVRLALGDGRSVEEIARGFLDIAIDNMAAAIRKISIARGHDVTRYTLACFGGAGGQHACAVADSLGMERVIIHPLAGLLSAYGIALAELKAIRQASWLRPLGEPFGKALSALEEESCRALVEQDADPGDIRVERRARLRLPGSDSTVEMTIAEPGEMRRRFHALHRQTYGYAEDDAEPVVDTLIAEAAAGGASMRWQAPEPGAGAAAIRTAGGWPAYRRADLADDDEVEGPALIVEESSTTVVEDGWSARRSGDGTLVLTRRAPLDRGRAAGTEVDPVRLEIYNNLFMAIAEEMGVALQATATSVNIKERLDFSCALFDRDGRLIANAPHIPVHLGSMGESIRTIIETRGEGRDGRGIRRGDAYVLNDPYRGGTHLPDVTVIMPVFYGASETPDAYVAARGHHADIGGIAPGSMPPESRTIDEEGVLIDNQLLVDEGRFRESEIRSLLGSGAYPARKIDRNIADLRAQLAACTRGAERLTETARHDGAHVIEAYMGHVVANAAESVRRLVDRLDNGSFAYPMDNGAEVKVEIRIDRANRSAEFDFSGTSDQLADNFNAPFSIVRAASIYVVRTLIDDSIPMNDGCLDPIAITVPSGSMLSPAYPAAVVAGNVETSQVVTDCLFAATGRLAPAQGTMNNFTFGNERYQYYETICGGSGAGPEFDGTDAVHTHMTNSRLTDPEILESRFPVRVERFAIRRGSGGGGAHHGGDGVVREITFLEPMRANILANRRKVAPRGIKGGGDALPGRNWVVRTDGSKEVLDATASAEVNAGDRFVIETPGGGGFGKGGA